MFKVFFTSIYDRLSKVYNRIKTSKAIKIIGKVIDLTGFASIVCSAFNIGCLTITISNHVGHKMPLTDIMNWIAVLSKRWVDDIKNQDFGWDIYCIFFPMVAAIMYTGIRAIKTSCKVIGMIKSMMHARKAHKSTTANDTQSNDVVDVFA